MTIEQSQPIPVEKGWPLLGVLPEVFGGQDPYEYLKNVMLKQGDLVQLNFGTRPVYLVSHPDYLQRILRDNHQNYYKPDMFYKSIRSMTGNGLGTSEGDLWLRQRRMIQPHLHRKQLISIFSTMTDAISEVLNDWDMLAENGNEIDLGDKVSGITATVMTRTMFGEDILPAVEIAKMNRTITQISQHIGRTLYSAIMPEWVPIPGQKEFELNRKTTREMVNLVIEKCRQEKDTSASLIKMLINSVDEESHEQMTEQQLFDEVMTIFLAGYETVATTLTWLGVALHNNPDVLRKLHLEIDQVLGTRPPSFEDVPRLTYTAQVFMEILRMYTVAPFLPRGLKEADQLGSYHLPANSLVLIFYHGVHHNPSVWDNPEVFDPERFAPERMAGQHPFAYVPFSLGPRKCAGVDFAILEGTLAIAMIFQKYDIKLIPNQKFVGGIGATMRPRNGVKATISFRTSMPEKIAQSAAMEQSS